MTSAAGPLARLLEQATPGPWHVSPDLDRVPCVRTQDGKTVADECDIEDAHLIALAPDGLRLLMDMAAELRYHDDCPNERFDDSGPDCVICPLLARFAELKARAAV